MNYRVLTITGAFGHLPLYPHTGETSLLVTFTNSSTSAPLLEYPSESYPFSQNGKIGAGFKVPL